MKTTKRFENAVSKLYNAFHENRLNAMDCSACAVGNICDGKQEWDDLGIFASNTYFLDDYESPNEPLEYEVLLALEVIKETGYTALELREVESLFLKECKYSRGTKDEHFKGLCAVVEYLAELDNIPNPMDYSKLFETENESAKYSLVEVFTNTPN